MKVVVDASAIIAIVSREMAVDEHIASATSVTAPDLAVPEVLNVCWKLRRARLVAPSVDVILAFFDRISVTSSIPYARDASALAQKLDHSVYDCLYAALAQREGARFVTADRRFARKLVGLKLDVVTF